MKTKKTKKKIVFYCKLLQSYLHLNIDLIYNLS